MEAILQVVKWTLEAEILQIEKTMTAEHNQL